MCLFFSLLGFLCPSFARAQTGTHGKTTITLLGGTVRFGNITNWYGEREYPFSLGVRVSRHLFLDQSFFGEVVFARNSFEYGSSTEDDEFWSRTSTSRNWTMLDVGFASNLISRYYTGRVGLYLLFGVGLSIENVRVVSTGPDFQYRDSNLEYRGLGSAAAVMEIALFRWWFLRFNGSAYGTVGGGKWEFPGVSLMAGLAVDL